MRFSDLLTRISQVGESTPRHLGPDPELLVGQSLEVAGPGQVAFLEAGHAMAPDLAACHAGAVLLPLDADLQRQATEAGLAWVALADPRLGFAEALEALNPRPRPPAGVHSSAVIDPSAQLGAGVHVGPRVVVGAGCHIGHGTTLHPGCVLYDDVQLGEDCEIHANAVLHPGTRLGRRCVIHSAAVIGSEGFGFVPTPTGWRKMPQTGRVVLEDGVEVGCGSMVDRPAVGETRLGAGSKIDNLVHVGHGVMIPLVRDSSAAGTRPRSSRRAPSPSAFSRITGSK